MICGALWLHFLRLTLTDFGRDPCGREIWRATRSFAFLAGKQRTSLPISRPPNFTKFEYNMFIGEAMNPSGIQFWNLSRKGSFFQKNAKNLIFFPSLVTSGRHISAIITDRRKFITKTRMWANAQPDGRPAEHRWRPLFNAAKFGWRPLLEAVQSCSQDAKPVEICRGAPNSRTDLSR